MILFVTDESIITEIEREKKKVFLRIKRVIFR